MNTKTALLPLALLAAPLWMGAKGCEVAVIDSNATCNVNGVVYKAGESVPVTSRCGDAQSCMCDETGEVDCAPAMERGCIPTCNDDGTQRVVGESWQVDCNTCSCGADGLVSCTDAACETGDGGASEGVTCEHNGQTYEPGDAFDLGDGCNGCSCGSDGLVTCTATVCPEPSVGCTFGETTFAEGESVVCPDGCNVCGCSADAAGNFGWASTDAACEPLAQVEVCPQADPGAVRTAVDVHYLDGDALALEVSPGDGCEPRTFRLCWDGAVLDSSPEQVNLWVEHIWAGGICDNSYEHDVVFDVSPLKSAGSSGLLLNLDGEELTYSF